MLMVDVQRQRLPHLHTRDSDLRVEHDQADGGADKDEAGFELGHGSCEALRSFSVVLEVRVSSPIGVLRKTIPALVRHTDPRNSMKGSIVTGSTGAGVGGGVSAAGSEGISAGADGSSARTGTRRVKTSTPAQKA